MIAVLLYFKILTNYVGVNILAEYFKIKAFGLIVYYLFSFRYSELSYILKAQNNYHITRMKNIFGLYALYILIISFLMIILFNISNIPLSYYRNHTFYTMRTDSRDRFGTPLEKRFTKLQIKEMMKRSGLKDIHFSNNAPFWCVVGTKL